MKVLFVASECAPMVKVGGLADYVGSLPKALKKLGLEVAIALPNYEFLTGAKVKNLPGTDIPIFYLGRAQDFPGEVYPKGRPEHERFANFSRLVVNFLDTRVFEPQVVHCQDYQSSLVIDIIKQRSLKVATVLTIHDVQNQGIADPAILDLANLSAKFLRTLDFDLKDGNLDMLLQGILNADIISTVSPTYAKEILDPAVVGEIAEVLRAREGRIQGILNGIDVEYFNPATDGLIFQNYGLANVATAKKLNKERLQKELSLTVQTRPPMLAMVTRIVPRKGLDLMVKVLPKIIDSGSQLVILGRGDEALEATLKGFAKIYPAAFAFVNRFDEALAHQIYAASDFFLVPSRTEPCGLTQMIACRYGSLPIVFRTGGLADTVVDLENGFVFGEFSQMSFEASLGQALATSKNDPAAYQKMVETAMKKDFSWAASSRQYLKLYGRALEYSFGIARGVGGEIRHDVFGGWSILSPERSKRPLKEVEVEAAPTVNGIESCPFEEGKEKESSGEVFRVGQGEPDTPGWQVRVIPNKYPILPAHEVVIHSPNHHHDLAALPLPWVEKVVWTYVSRYRHYEDKGYVHIFCNHGQPAAASLSHPHSQIIVFDDLPQATLNVLEAGQNYFEKYGGCPYCSILKRELPNGRHLIWQNETMVLITPYASEWPYEMMIVPKFHRQTFGNIKDAEIKGFSQILQLALKLLKSQFQGDPAYNFWIHSLPDLLGLAKSALYYHWHVDIIPRVKILGGLELGAGVMVDDLISPEEAAKNLRRQLSRETA